MSASYSRTPSPPPGSPMNSEEEERLEQYLDAMERREDRKRKRGTAPQRDADHSNSATDEPPNEPPAKRPPFELVFNQPVPPVRPRRISATSPDLDAVRREYDTNFEIHATGDDALSDALALRVFPVQRGDVRYWSDAFAAMLDSPMTEATSGVLRIPFSPEVVEIAVQHMAWQRNVAGVPILPTDSTLAWHVMRMAHMYGQADLLARAKSVITKLNPDLVLLDGGRFSIANLALALSMGINAHAVWQWMKQVTVKPSPFSISNTYSDGVFVPLLAFAAADVCAAWVLLMPEEWTDAMSQATTIYSPQQLDSLQRVLFTTDAEPPAAVVMTRWATFLAHLTKVYSVGLAAKGLKEGQVMVLMKRASFERAFQTNARNPWDM